MGRDMATKATAPRHPRRVATILLLTAVSAILLVSVLFLPATNPAVRGGLISLPHRPPPVPAATPSCQSINATDSAFHAEMNTENAYCILLSPPSESSVQFVWQTPGPNVTLVAQKVSGPTGSDILFENIIYNQTGSFGESVSTNGGGWIYELVVASTPGCFALVGPCGTNVTVSVAGSWT
jgi:hypothetical protein